MSIAVVIRSGRLAVFGVLFRALTIILDCAFFSFVFVVSFVMAFTANRWACPENSVISAFPASITSGCLRVLSAGLWWWVIILFVLAALFLYWSVLWFDA